MKSTFPTGPLISGWTRLVGGNALAGVLQLLALAILARAVSLEVFGLILLIHTYVRVVDRLVNFQSVGVLTRWLAEAEAAGDRAWFAGLAWAGLAVDGLAALGATVVALALLWPLAALLGLPDNWLLPAALFCLVLPTRVLGVTEAVLRNFEGFAAIGLRDAAQAGLRVVGWLVALLAGADGPVFLLLWLASEAIANCAFIAAACLQLRAQGIGMAQAMGIRAAIARAEDFWPSLWHANFAGGLRMVTQDCDVMLAAALFGPTGAGLLRVAKNVANVLYQFGHPLTQAASAPIARMLARGDHAGGLAFARRLSLWAALAGLAASCAAIPVAGPLLALAFGEEFRSAALLTLVLLFARACYLGGAALVPTMLALGIGRLVLQPVLIATLAFAAALAAGFGPLGLLAFAFAQLAFDLVWTGSGWLLVQSRVRQLAQVRA